MQSDVIEKVRTHVQNHTQSTVSVYGLGGSGKTQFCKQLMTALQNPCAYIQQDWYLFDSSFVRQQKIESIFAEHLEWDSKKYGNPYNWYDWHQFKMDLIRLKREGSLVINNAWNQQTGNKDSDLKIILQKGGFILIDGIYLLDPMMQEISDLTIFLEISSDLARKRADNRDAHRSNHQYLQHKEKLAQFYEVPYMNKYRNKASIIINNSDDENP